jgi:hypothetical protein
MRPEQNAHHDVWTGKSVMDHYDETCNNLADSGFSTTPCSDPRVLILGSFPSRKSLERTEYYGNPKNHFWSIMEVLLSIDSTLPYAVRIRALGEHRALPSGIWSGPATGPGAWTLPYGSLHSMISRYSSKGTQNSGSSPLTGRLQRDISNGSG